MKVQRTLLPALSASAVLATASKSQAPLGIKSAVSQAISAFGFGLDSNSVLSTVDRLWNGPEPKEKTVTWTALNADDELRTFAVQDGITYELLTHPEFPNYQIRVRSPKLCDPDVKQYSGYLDIDDDKHLFFWFFESRKAPSKAPLVLWLNGGPGCSSSTGLLFELGPCGISKSGRGTKHNPYGWNEFANMIFLDQPVNVGYSYSEHSKINNTPAAAEDVYVFLQLFLARYKEYDSAPFSIAAESYGGHYAPHIASTIHKHNKEIKLSRSDARTKRINLSSILIGNGLTEPKTQMGTVPKQACDGPYPIYDDPEGPECTSLRSKVPTCQRLIQSCYDYNSRFTCVPAGIYCNSALFSGIQQLGLNPYDTRRKCDRREDKDGPLCYPQMADIETYLNNKTIKNELGVASSTEFASCNMNVNQAFFTQGDGVKNSAALLPEMLSEGVRLLIYAGNADFMCNAIGNLEWMEKLENPFLEEFNNNGLVPWQLLKSGKVAGMVKSAGGGGFSAGNYTYVVIHEAGHMVPYDQPEASLDLFVRWLTNVPLA
ncbi:hypothetical protein FRB94_010711 [Tulasnella sp. JGI-2019a]|nr:hypothetical protein FRB94_010711 [Tulasnella sp. JGI-2019a]KAG9025327.1 hypothetical protein FRB95_010275 [Tulasnella sp. JGI-2019a]